MSALGRHILVEFTEADPDILSDVTMIEQSMEAAARKAGATLINSTFHHFSPFGVSGVVVIQESHLAIHTWPEYGYAAVDLFTCGDMVDPWVSFEHLRESFKAGQSSAMEMARGEMRLMKKLKDVDYSGEMPTNEEIKYTRNIWFTERSENMAFSLRHEGRKLFEKKSDYQKVEVYKTHQFGNMLTLDGMIMCTEIDENAYHEMMVHVPMLTHPEPKKILIIGGGDGGTAREVLKHEVENVTMVEIDEVVIEASREHLKELSSALDHPKLDLKVEDGIEFVRNTADSTYDIVLVDSTDPIGPGEGLFSTSFYKEVNRIMKDNAYLVVQGESPHYNAKVFAEIHDCFGDIFGPESVWKYLFFVPTYPSGMWSFSIASKGGLHPLNDINAEKVHRFTDTYPLKYYNLDIHNSAFALPNFVQELIKPKSIAHG